MTPSTCGCPRQADWWLCQARPDLNRTGDGRRCDLGTQLADTGTDMWPPRTDARTREAA